MLYFPVNESDDLVSLSELPGDPDEALELLRMELVPLKLWRLLAVEYFRSGQFSNGERILQAGCAKEVQSVPVYAKETKDQVGLFNALAGLLLNRVLVGGETNMTEVRDLLDRASVMDVLNQFTWIGKGYSLLVAWEENGGSNSNELLHQAVKQFQLAIDDTSLGVTSVSVVLGHLGKGHALLLQKNFKQSLEEYRFVLRSLGSEKVPQSVRLAIGVCQFHLGRPGKAVEAWRRVVGFRGGLENGPAITDSIVGLAALGAGTGIDLATVFQSDATASPSVLLLLAYQCLSAGLFAEAERVCSVVLSRASLTVPLRSLCLLVQAGSVHAQNRFEDAQKIYSSAASIVQGWLAESGKRSNLPSGVVAKTVAGHPIVVAAKCGAAQCALGLGKETEAFGMMSAEKCGPRYGDSVWCLRLWSFLQTRQLGRRKKFHPGKTVAQAVGVVAAQVDAAIEKCLKEEKNSDRSGELLRVRAQLQLECVQNEADCAVLLESLPKEEETDVLLVRAALCAATGDLPGANEALNKIVGETDKSSETVTFMKGYLLELAGDEVGARAVYDSLSKGGEILGSDLSEVMAAARIKLGQLDIPTDPTTSKPIQSDGADLLLLAKSISSSQSSLSESIKLLTSSSSLKYDQYANVLLGDLFYRKAAEHGSFGESKDEEKALDNALKYFLRAMEQSQSAFGAVCGVAGVLGHKGRCMQALELLKNLADNKSGSGLNDAIVQINLGHLLLDEGKADSAKRAMKCYEFALKLAISGKQHAMEIRMYLGSVLFQLSLFEDALVVLGEEHFVGANAKQISQVQFNRAVVMENFAAQTLMDKNRAQSMAWIEKAIAMLKDALELFRSLQARGVVRSGLAEHIVYCESTVPQAEQWRETRDGQLAEEARRRAEVEATKKEREERDRALREQMEAAERERSEEMHRQAEIRMADLKETFAQTWKNEKDDGGPDAPLPDGTFKKKRKPAAGKKKHLKKRKLSGSSSSSSSSSDSSSSDSSGSDGSSSDSDSSSSSDGDAKSEKKNTTNDVRMEDLFGPQEHP